MSWRDLILHDFRRKFFSLIAATLLWLTIYAAIHNEKLPGAVEATREFPRLPITVMTVATEARGFKVAPPVVSVTLAGDASVLAKLSAADVAAFVSLTDAGEAAKFRRRVVEIGRASCRERVYVLV